MTVATSPNNFQVWLAVSDGTKEKEHAKQFRTRVRRGAGADHSATGAVRLAGSTELQNPVRTRFPIVVLSQVSPGRMTTVAALEKANLIALEPALPPAAFDGPLAEHEIRRAPVAAAVALQGSAAQGLLIIRRWLRGCRFFLLLSCGLLFWSSWLSRNNLLRSWQFVGVPPAPERLHQLNRRYHLLFTQADSSLLGV
jgi:hypothetical protein